MKSISMLEFRKGAEDVLKQVVKGQAFVLTYRGKAVAKLEPMGNDAIAADDPIYHLDELAGNTGKAITNAEIDRIVYGG